MDFEKIKTDFKQRYERSCEKIYFAGLGIELFSENAKMISGCASIGEAMALAKRDDGRITVQFSGSDSMTSFNVDELDAHLGLRTARLLKNAQNSGITVLGADIFICKNSRITDLLEPLIIGGLSAFCKNVPRKETLLLRFENYKENLMALSGKSKCATLFDGQRVSHIPFFGGRCKVVITYTGGDFLNLKRPPKSSFSDALSALKKGDMEKFGAFLDRDTRNLLKGNRYDRQEGIFLSATKTKDALGNGVLPNGSVFSLVCDDKVDRFIHNVSSRHQKYFGGVPDFYVTDFYDSGFYVD